MKRWDAMKKLDAGKTVKRKSDGVKFRVQNGNDEIRMPGREWVVVRPSFAHMLPTHDFVVVRKVKKPKFSEADFEPVGTMPGVGDKIALVRDGTGPSGVSPHDVSGKVNEVDGCFAYTALGKVGLRCFSDNDKYFSFYRILKRRKRNVFKEPVVGDVVKYKGRYPSTVVCVSSVEVVYVRGGHYEVATREWWESNGELKGYTVLHRAK